MTGERERLVNRIRQAGRVIRTSDAQPSADARGPDPTRVAALEERVAHLERLLEGLQDSVHREAERQGKRITELEVRTQPGALGEALSKNARERGL
jgi:hypothetical protein